MQYLLQRGVLECLGALGRAEVRGGHRWWGPQRGLGGHRGWIGGEGGVLCCFEDSEGMGFGGGGSLCITVGAYRGWGESLCHLGAQRGWIGGVLLHRFGDL